MTPGNRPDGDDISTGNRLDVHAMPGHLIRRMHQASQAIFDGEMAKNGLDLTSVQYAALAAIAAQPGLDQATLASIIAFDRVTTGGVIDRLEAKGLVRREIAKGDRRSRRLHLETLGAKILETARPIVEHVQAKMMAGLDPKELAKFLKLLQKALDAVGDVRRATTRTA